MHVHPFGLSSSETHKVQPLPFMSMLGVFEKRPEDDTLHNLDRLLEKHSWPACNCTPSVKCKCTIIPKWALCYARIHPMPSQQVLSINSIQYDSSLFEQGMFHLTEGKIKGKVSKFCAIVEQLFASGDHHCDRTNTMCYFTLAGVYFWV